MNSSFYIVARASIDEGGGIVRYQLNDDGVADRLGVHPINGSSWASLSTDGKHLYASCVMDDDSAVTAYAVKPDRSLVELNRMNAEGKSGCHVTTDPSGKFLFCANYGTGDVAVFSLNDDGSLKERLRNVPHAGNVGPNVKRQDGPHPHFVSPTPDGQFLVATDLGLDTLTLYPFDSKKGIDENAARIFKVDPPGSGPRHLIFNQSGTIAYLLDELGNTVHSLAYANGEFKTLHVVSTLPEGFAGETKAAAIRLSHDERFLFASNRGHDSIAVFALDGLGGMSLNDVVSCGGESPRDVNFLPGIRKFAAANEFSDTVVLFDYDPKTGGLAPDGQVLRHKRPLAICW